MFLKSRTKAMSFRFCSPEVSDNLSRCHVWLLINLTSNSNGRAFYPKLHSSSIFFMKNKLQETNIKEFKISPLKCKAASNSTLARLNMNKAVGLPIHRHLVHSEENLREETNGLPSG